MFLCNHYQEGTMPVRRFTDYLGLGFITIGLITLFLSFVLCIHAQTQSQNYLEKKVKDLEELQKSEQTQITGIDKRLLVIETKQDAIIYIGCGLLSALGLLLADRVKEILSAIRRRRQINR